MVICTLLENSYPLATTPTGFYTMGVLFECGRWVGLSVVQHQEGSTIWLVLHALISCKPLDIYSLQARKVTTSYAMSICMRPGLHSCCRYLVQLWNAGWCWQSCFCWAWPPRNSSWGCISKYLGHGMQASNACGLGVCVYFWVAPLCRLEVAIQQICNTALPQWTNESLVQPFVEDVSTDNIQPQTIQSFHKTLQALHLKIQALRRI